MNVPEDSKFSRKLPAFAGGSGNDGDGGEFGPRIVYRGQPVMTTEQLAKAYEVEPDRIHDGHRRNPDRFDSGQHFFKLAGVDLREFKNQPAHSRLLAARTPHLILWTEAGALRHAKLLESPKAWEVFGKLEDAYFLVKSGAGQALPPPLVSDPIIIARENRLLITAQLRLLKLAGVEGPRALVAASTAVKSQTGYDALGALGLSSMADPVKDLTVIPREIGIKLGGLTSARVNILLEQAGYQVQERDHKGRSKWALTDKGRAAGADYDIRARSNETGTAQQIMWPLSIVDKVRDLIGGEA